MPDSITNCGDSSSRDILGNLILTHDVPLYAQLEVTRRCNLSCGHCYQSCGRDANGLTKDKIHDLLKQMQQLGVLFLVVTGGEPTLLPFWMEVLKQAIALRFVVVLKTNALALTKEDVEKLASLGIYELQVSIYHDVAEQHDTFVGVSGAWEKATSAMGQFVQLGGRAKAEIVLMNWNHSRAAALEKMCKQEGWLYQLDSRIELHDDGGETPKKFRGSSEAVASTLCSLQFWKDSDDSFARKVHVDNPVCGFGRNNLVIGFDGNVYACMTAPGNRLGNVHESSLEEIWSNKQRLNEMRNVTWKQSKKCRECEIISFCYRCPASAAVEHGDITRPAALDCEMARVRYLVGQQQKGGDDNG